MEWDLPAAIVMALLCFGWGCYRHKWKTQQQYRRMLSKEIGSHYGVRFIEESQSRTRGRVTAAECKEQEWRMLALLRDVHKEKEGNENG